MSNTFLKRLCLTTAVALYAPSLLGTENTNDQANINRPQVYGQQYQQPPNFFVPQNNTLPWMDFLPQNQVISLVPPQYVNTPMGPYVIYQTTIQTVYPAPQYNPMPMMQNHLAPIQNQNMLPETRYNNSTAPQEAIGMKRDLEPYTEGYNPGPGLWAPSQQQTLTEPPQNQDNERQLSYDYAYMELVGLEQEMWRAITILRLLPEALEANYDLNIPPEIFCYIIQNCCPLKYSLNFIFSKIQDEDLLKFKSIKIITHLYLDKTTRITDEGLAPLTNLTSLKLNDNTTTTDQGLASLTNLIELDLGLNTTITDEGLTRLTKLTSLELSQNTMITDQGLTRLTNLTRLNLKWNYMITDKALVSLPNLTGLDLNDNITITNEGLKPLTKLISLDLSCNLFRNKTTDQGLTQLTNLTHLSLKHNKQITDKGLVSLPNLTRLDLNENTTITNEGLKPLTKLTSLDLRHNKVITDQGLTRLTNLASLDLWNNKVITDQGLALLTNLTRLDLRNNKMITNKVVALLTKLTNLDLSYNDKITDKGIALLTNLTQSGLLGNNNMFTDKMLNTLPKLKMRGR